MKKAIFAVRLETALKVRPFISKAETRYYLQGIRITALESGGATCTATDGHRLGVARDEHGFCDQETIVKIPNFIKLRRKTKYDSSKLHQWLVGIKAAGGGYIAIISTEEEDARVIAAEALENPQNCEMCSGNAFIDATYPSIEKVVVDYDDCSNRASINTGYLSSFGQHVNLAMKDDSTPILVGTSDPNMFGVLMPMRNGVATVPTWFREPTPKAKPAAANDGEAATPTTETAA